MSEAETPPLGPLDLTLFVLPVVSERAFGLDLPEPPELVQGARGRRPRIKRHFWAQLMQPITFRPDFTIEPRAYCPLSDERIAELTDWVGLFGEPEYTEQPVDILNAMDERMPQFSLRNLVRYEKDAWPDDLRYEWKTLRELPHELGLDEVRTLAVHPKMSLHEDWNLDALAETLRAQRDIFHTLKWSTLRFTGGRKREPSEEERRRQALEGAAADETEDASDIL